MNDLAFMRLTSQQLFETKCTTPKELLSWMVAMQAQDFPMARWAIGARVIGTIDLDVLTALDEAKVIRTHLLRPTWHFVAAEDVYWLLELTAPQIKSSQKARERQLELTETVYAKCNSVIENSLKDVDYLTREQLLDAIQRAGMAIDQNRSAHLLMRAEVDQVICNGPMKSGKLTYALLARRVPKIKRLTKEEALANLAQRYFYSRCPATQQDFAWWSGLPAGDVRQAMDLVRANFQPEKIRSHTYMIPNDLPTLSRRKLSAHLLPSFDEIIVSYNERSVVIPPELETHMKEISDRGVFRPVIVVNGQVAGIWKRTI
ncbi:MAG TPA: winged helix DNA-binding domain-containing protein, partial [Anaerolineales bacterium]